MSFIVNIGFSQSKEIITATQLVANWQAENGFFPEEFITLKRINTKFKIEKTITSYYFKKDNTLSVNILFPDKLDACRYGMAHVTKSNWKLNKNELYIYFEGENIVTCEAIYIVESFTKDKLKLKREKLIQNK